ncbi:MAG: class I SAM-dependent methyltransferase [Burkholderiaceae bacterium]|nr:class I SAM-dependent methyltransferase [Burkholderiaceae bacterium]
MTSNRSVDFFDEQFRRQVRQRELQLNPFEAAALPHLSGQVLDFGCGLGNLACAAARRGCRVLALDASPTAIAHLRATAAAESLPIRAEQADLRTHALRDSFDAVVSIGLLMFFDCATAFTQLVQLRAHVKPGGIAVINVLVQGTTFLDMFDAEAYCLFAADELPRQFAGWETLSCDVQRYPAPGDTVKVFCTLMARKPGDMGAPPA